MFAACRSPTSLSMRHKATTSSEHGQKREEEEEETERIFEKTGISLTKWSKLLDFFECSVL